MAHLRSHRLSGVIDTIMLRPAGTYAGITVPTPLCVFVGPFGNEPLGFQRGNPMSYRIVARNSDASTGIAKSNAREALRAVRELRGEGFELTAIIDDDGDRVPVETLERLAVTEGTSSH